MRLLNVRKNTLNVRKMRLNFRKMRSLNVRKMQLLYVRKNTLNVHKMSIKCDRLMFVKCSSQSERELNNPNLC